MSIAIWAIVLVFSVIVGMFAKIASVEINTLGVNHYFDAREDLNTLVREVKAKGFRITSTYQQELSKHIKKEQKEEVTLPFNHRLEIEKNGSRFSIEVFQTMDKSSKKSVTINQIKGKLSTSVSLYIYKAMKNSSARYRPPRSTLCYGVKTDSRWAEELEKSIKDRPIIELMELKIEMEEPMAHYNTIAFKPKIRAGWIKHHLNGPSDLIVSMLVGYVELVDYLKNLDNKEANREVTYTTFVPAGYREKKDPVQEHNTQSFQEKTPLERQNINVQVRQEERKTTLLQPTEKFSPVPISLNTTTQTPDMNNCCVICFKPVREGRKVVRMACCEVKVHTEHLEEWLYKKNRCPYCGKINPEVTLSAKIAARYLR